MALKNLTALFITSLPQPRVRQRLDNSPLLCSANHVLHIPLATTASYIYGFLKHPQNTFTLMMATAMFAETLKNLQHSTRLIPKSRIYTLKSSRENLR
jgi:hypothetical protein